MTDACTEHLGDNQNWHKRLRLAILGPAGAGKDTAAAWLRKHAGLYGEQSTSEFYWHTVNGYPYRGLAQMKATPEGRADLAQRIAEYNQVDGSGCLLYKNMADSGYTVFTGIRRLAELRSAAAHGLVTHALWIERPGCEDGTLEIRFTDAVRLFGDRAFFVENDGSEESLYGALAVRWEWMQRKLEEASDGGA